ncbi:MAG TPA: MFS transporter [Thermomicrobiales bacterium]|nr:MFS transporter [Thermomicrobiales bacterium]
MHENPHHERRWWILAALVVAQMMIVLDGTVVNIALPSAQKSLGFSDDDRQWIITAYSLAFGSLLLLGGKLSDILGRRRTLIIGLIGFAAASAIGGAAQSFLMLAVSRAAQGVFAALLAPSVLALMTTTFTEPKERNKAFGIYGGVLASGASVGLLLGGALTEWLDWRAVMYVNIPIAILAVFGAYRLLVNQRPDERPRIDGLGAATVTAGLFSLVYGLSHAETSSWSDPVTVGLLIAGVVLLGLFLFIESRVDHPLLPLRVLKDRNRGAAYLTMAIAAVAMFGTFLFLTYHLQGIMGYSPVKTGAAFLPMTLVLMATAIIASTKLRPIFGPRPLMVAGMSLGAIGMVLLTQLHVDSSYLTHIVPTLVLEGLGLGLIFSTASNNATLGLLRSDAGVGSATTNASQQIGGSIGTALLSTLAATATADYLVGSQPTNEAVRVATVHGFTTAFMWSAIIFAVGAVVALVGFTGGASTTQTASEPTGEPVVVH